MRSVFPVVVSALCGLALAVVFVVGVRAARTRVLSMCGFASVGCALGATGWWASVGGGAPATWLATPSAGEVATRVAFATLSIAAGLAHGVVFSIAALPAAKTWTRLVLVPLGMWTGTFAAMWFAVPFAGAFLGWVIVLLASGTLTAWCILPFWSRERGFVLQGVRRIPTVRFPCPRCGTRVDWARGVASCTDCGLFVHMDWPADELHAAEGHPVVLKPRRSVHFACPECGRENDWPCGDSACGACGLKLSMHWNVHRTR